MSKTNASEESEDLEPDVPDACALKANPPAATTPAAAPTPMTTVLRFIALCFIDLSHSRPRSVLILRLRT
ncbi:hypothetical protein SAVCW2_66850 [Streptomyces avermitilis]|uniref:Uncharacterized protein n=1 Tax=Streptomyces avermitilis TaxID=33903 RepID=A0A499VS28_STRAX|nr:hypothetical protein SAVMC3_18460 [Streptomyces avermitilis]GDY87486.1 hypothetical protein SAVCW2_66850 [Streptomyces avermitilis]